MIPKKTVILDTNFLMIPFTLNVDVVEEIKNVADFNYSLKIIDKTIDELKKISINEKNAKLRNSAKLALKYVDSNKISKIKTLESQFYLDVDSIIIEYSKSNPETTVVATQDIELRRKLRQINTPLFVLRQKKYVVFQKY